MDIAPWHDPSTDARAQGISDAPAWVVSEANMYARLTGKAPFVIYQGAWNVLERDMEREIIPMCRAQGTLHLTVSASCWQWLKCL